MFLRPKLDGLLEKICPDPVAAKRVHVEHSEVGVCYKFPRQRLRDRESTDGFSCSLQQLVLHVRCDFQDVLDVVVLASYAGEGLAILVKSAPQDFASH